MDARPPRDPNRLRWTPIMSLFGQFAPARLPEMQRECDAYGKPDGEQVEAATPKGRP